MIITILQYRVLVVVFFIFIKLRYYTLLIVVGVYTQCNRVYHIQM